MSISGFFILIGVLLQVIAVIFLAKISKDKTNKKQDNTVTNFCPNCGTQMNNPNINICPYCNTDFNIKN